MRFDDLVDNRLEGETPLRQAQLVMLRMLKIVDRICKENDLKYWLDSGTLLGAVRHEGFIPWDDDLDICMVREDYNKFLEIAAKELPDDVFIQTQETDKGSKWKWTKLRDKYSTVISYNELTRKKKRPYHRGIFIDIFPFDVLPCRNKVLKMTVNRSFQKISNKWLHKGYPVFNLLAHVPLKVIGYKRMIEYSQKINKLRGDCPLIGFGVEVPYIHYFNKSDFFPLKKMKFEDLQSYVPRNAEKVLSRFYGDFMALPPQEVRKGHFCEIYPTTPCKHHEVKVWGNNLISKGKREGCL